MPDLVQTADNLKMMPDQWLAQQMQQPSGEVPPWLVASEMARREKLRSGSAKAQAPQSSVSQDLIRSLYAKIPPTAGLGPQQSPPGAIPPGMPPVNFNPGSGGMGGPAPGTPPANFRMPPRPMAEGGEVDDDDGEDGADDTTPTAAAVATQPTRQAVLQSLTPPPAPATGYAARSAPTTPLSAAASGPIGPSPADQKGVIARAKRQGTIDGYIDAASAKYGVRPELIRAMIRTESSGQAGAVNKKSGALGLMQLMPDTAKAMGVKNPLNPQQNIEGGTKYLAQLLDQFNGDENLALAAYNAGPGTVQKYGGVPPYKETKNYIRSIEGSKDNPLRMTALSDSDIAPPGSKQNPLSMTALSDSDITQSAAPAANAAPGTNAANMATGAPAPAATAPPATAPVGPQPIWKPPEPEDLKFAKKREQELQKQTDDLIQNYQSFDPDTVWTPEAAQKAKDLVRTFIGPEPDNSKWQGALQTLMGQAQQMMHPNFSSMLMQFGLGLMASRSHNFGVAVGEAGLGAMAAQQKQQQQGSALFMQAMNAGMRLQDRTNAYQEKLGQLAFEIQKTQQTAGIDNEKSQLDVIKQTQKELQDAHKDRATAQAAYEKSMSTPMATEMQAIGALAHAGIVRDPSLSPLDQIQRDAPQLLQTIFPVKSATTKAPSQSDQYLLTAVQQTAQAHGLKPDDYKTLQDLPSNLRQEAIDLNSKFGAGRAVATEQGKADLISPEAIEFIGSKLLNNEPITSRNPLLLAKAQEWAMKKAHEMGMTSTELMLQQGLVKANKAALVQLTKNIETVEPFITLADRNADKLNELAQKIPNTGAPAMNKPLRQFEQQWKGNPALAPFYAQLMTTRTELARVIGSPNAGGVIHESQLAEIQKALGDDATPEMIMGAVKTLQDEAHARRDIYRAQQQDLAGRTVVGNTEKKPETGGGGTKKQDQPSTTSLGPLPQQLSPTDKGKIYTNRKGKKIRILEVDPADAKRFRFEEVQ